MHAQFSLRAEVVTGEKHVICLHFSATYILFPQPLLSLFLKLLMEIDGIIRKVVPVMMLLQNSFFVLDGQMIR